MGCTQSKIENEEAVARCKDRKHFMNKAVTTRNEFAAAHSAYLMALKNTGAALSDYSEGEVNDLLRPSINSHHHLHHHPQPAPQPTYENLPPPPPPLPNFSPSPLKRSFTMPEFSIPKPDFKPTDTIQEEEDDDEDDDGGGGVHGDEDDHDNAGELNHRRSRGRGGGSHGGGGGGNAETTRPPPPPSPPHTPPGNPVPPPPPDSKGMTWDYFFSMDMPPNLSENDEIRPSDVDESDGGGYHNNGFQRSEMDVHENGGGGGIGSTSNSNEVEPRTPEKVIVELDEMTPTPVKKPKQIVHSNTAPLERKQGKGGPNLSLLQVFSYLDDHFLKASESAQEVSKMLEATRLHYHSNFADNRGHIDHSARVMRVITWNRSFRGIPNADDGKDDFDSDEYETHATILDKLLAWEKKLYDEVKTGELMKLEYQRKVALLNKQKKRGASAESLEKTKAAVSHLHTRYIVDMQSMDSTVSEINRLRDKQLYPKLTDLVDGYVTKLFVESR